MFRKEHFIPTITDNLSEADFKKNYYWQIYTISDTLVTINDGDEMLLLSGELYEININKIITNNDSAVFLVGRELPYKSTGSFDIKTGNKI